MTDANRADDGARRAAEIAESWRDNAAAWTEVVRAGVIESRRVATDAAILRAALAARPSRALDLGCGEGWLVRALGERGVTAVGVDGSAPLVAAAAAAGGGTYLCLSYDEIAADPARCGKGFDVVVANFALLEERITPLLAAVRGIATPRGRLLVQTVHPDNVAPPRADGWRVEDFRGFGDSVWKPMPWYFRTLPSWNAELRAAGFELYNIEEPRHPEDGRRLSLLLDARPRRQGRP